MNYNMIVLDLDGTLTNRDKVITPRTKQSLMEAQKRGIKVVLASGRPTYGVMPLAEELELEKYEGYILSFNGGIIMDCRTREVIFKKELPVEANRKILDLAEKEQVDILTYQGARILTNNQDNPYAKIESGINHLKLKQIEDLKAYLDFPVPKFLMLDDETIWPWWRHGSKRRWERISASTAQNPSFWKFYRGALTRPSVWHSC